MRKLLLMLAAVGMIFTACEGGEGIEEDNGGMPFVPEITYSPKSCKFNSEGGKQSITITANFEYDIIEDVDWIDAKRLTGGNGIYIIADKNKNTFERSANIILSNNKYDISKTIKVSQYAYTPSITIKPESINFDADGGEQTVEIIANFEYEVTTDSKWITITNTKDGCTISAVPYYEKDTRTANIVISNKKYDISKVIKVTQSPFIPKITIEPESINISADGGKQSVKITADFEHKATTDAQWLTITKIKDGYTISAPAYYEVEPRVAEVTISSEKYDIVRVIKVSQSAFVPKITIEPETLNVSAEGDEQSVKITANFEYKASTDAQWLTITKNNEGYSIYTPANYETESRSANIVISSTKYGISKNIKVSQDKLNLKRCIIYTTSNNEALTFSTNITTFGANIISHIYNNGKGIVKFDGDVTMIYSAFSNCIHLTSVTIPNSVIWIGISAFEGCNSLKSVTIPDSVTWIEAYTFYGCSSLTSITIPDSVTEIGNYAFADCSSLTSVTIPDSVTAIGDSAFSGCSGELLIDSKIIETSYEHDAYPSYRGGWLFGSKFTKLTIGNDITKIGDYAFADCSSLTSVTIPDSVTSIGERAFCYGCDYLTSITIPNSVTAIGEEAFAGCYSLTSITIPDSVTSIGERAFAYCNSVTSVTIPNSVTAIGEGAFAYCSGKLTFDSNVGGVYGGEFSEVTIGNSVTSIRERAFYRCESLTSVTIPKSVTAIGEEAFCCCSSLTRITIPDSVTWIGNSAFYRCESLTSVTMSKSVTSIGEYTFHSCSSLTRITIPDSVTWIEYSAFKDCVNLQSVTMSKSVTSIGEDVFSNCSNLTAFYGQLASSDNRCLIIKGVLTLFAPAGLTEYVIPSSVTSIKEDVFSNCSNLTSVTIPNSVTSIGDGAFYNCNNLKSVYCKATTPPTGGDDMFSYYYSFYSKPIGCKIYVPKASVSAYKSKMYWSDYASDIVGYDF